MDRLLCRYSEYIEPFTSKRRTSARERSQVLVEWAGLVQQAFISHALQFSPHVLHEQQQSADDETGGSFHRNETNFCLLFTRTFVSSPQESLVGSSCSAASSVLCTSPEQFVEAGKLRTVFSRFLRYTTLRKIVDDVLEQRQYVSDAHRGCILRGLLRAAAYTCNILPCEDNRNAKVRRAFPWFDMQDTMESSDEDRDDGCPRPYSEAFRTACELLVAHWHDIVSSLTLPSSLPLSSIENIANTERYGMFCEEVKLLLLSCLTFHTDSRSTGPCVAIVLLLLRTVLTIFHDASRVATLPGVSELSFGSSPVDELCSLLTEYSHSYVIKDDGRALNAWCTALELRPSLRLIHTKLLIFAMRNGMFQPSLQRGGDLYPSKSITTRDYHQNPLSSPFDKAASLTLVEVMLLVLERQLSNNGPSCTAEYLHRYPSRYGEESGSFLSSTEVRLISEAEVIAAELVARAEMLTYEVQKRREVVMSTLSEDYMQYPRQPAGLPAEFTNNCVKDVTYEARKRVRKFLDSVCPDRYPWEESLVACGELPEASALLAEREQLSLIQTEVLRIVRQELHLRLEWTRLESHSRDHMRMLSQHSVHDMHVKKQHELMLEEQRVRMQINVVSEEDIERCGVECIEWFLDLMRVEQHRIFHFAKSREAERVAADVQLVKRCVEPEESESRESLAHCARAEYQESLMWLESQCRRSILFEYCTSRTSQELFIAEASDRDQLMAHEGKARAASIHIALGQASLSLRPKLLPSLSIYGTTYATFARGDLLRVFIACANTNQHYNDNEVVAPTSSAMSVHSLLTNLVNSCIAVQHLLSQEVASRQRLLLNEYQERADVHVLFQKSNLCCEYDCIRRELLWDVQLFHTACAETHTRLELSAQENSQRSELNHTPEYAMMSILNRLNAACARLLAPADVADSKSESFHRVQLHALEHKARCSLHREFIHASRAMTWSRRIRSAGDDIGAERGRVVVPQDAPSATASHREVAVHDFADVKLPPSPLMSDIFTSSPGFHALPEAPVRSCSDQSRCSSTGLSPHRAVKLPPSPLMSDIFTSSPGFHALPEVPVRPRSDDQSRCSSTGLSPHRTASEVSSRAVSSADTSAVCFVLDLEGVVKPPKSASPIGDRRIASATPLRAAPPAGVSSSQRPRRPSTAQVSRPRTGVPLDAFKRYV